MATVAAAEQPAGRFAKDHLKAFVERVERLEEEKKAIGDDIRDVYAEAKANGFDVKALRTIVRLRKQDADDRREQEAILETYMRSEEHTSELQSQSNLVCRLLLEKKKSTRHYRSREHCGSASPCPSSLSPFRSAL